MPQKNLAMLPVDWKKIVYGAKDERRKVSVSEGDVDSAIRWLLESRASHFQALKKIERGDAAEIDFEISSKGKTLPHGKIENQRLVVGSGGYMPGFEDALLGMGVGEEKNFSLVSPRNYWLKEFAARNLDFHVKVKSVHKIVVPELTDDFARSVGKFKDKEDLKRSIKEGIQKEKEEKERDRFRLFLLERIGEKSKIEFSEELLGREITTMLAELKASVASMALPWEEYLRQIKKNEQELSVAFRERAERRIRYALILKAVAEEEGIEPETKEVEDEMNRFLLRFSSPQEAEKSIDVSSLAQYTKRVLQNEKVFQHLEKIAHTAE